MHDRLLFWCAQKNFIAPSPSAQGDNCLNSSWVILPDWLVWMCFARVSIIMVLMQPTLVCGGLLTLPSPVVQIYGDSSSHLFSHTGCIPLSYYSHVVAFRELFTMLSSPLVWTVHAWAIVWYLVILSNLKVVCEKLCANSVEFFQI